MQRSILRLLEYLFVVIVIVICLNGWRMVLTSGIEETVETMTEANRSFQIVSGTLYAIAAIYLLAHSSRFIRVCRRNWPLILLVAIVVMSALWSVYPVVTLRRAAALVLTTGFGAYLALRFPPDVALKLVAWACGLAAIATVILTVVDPSIAIQQKSTGEQVWRGIFGHKNAMGRAMAFGLLTFVAATFVVRPAVRLLTIGGALLCGVLLFLSMSRGGWVTAAVTLMAMPLLVLMLQWNRFSPAVRISMVGLAAIIGVVLLIGLYTYGLALIGRDETFSGRQRIWEVSIRIGMKHVVQGAGYRSFWTDKGASDVYSADFGSSLGNGHNGYLDTWLEIGVIGLGAFLLVFAITIRRVVLRLMQWPDATCVWFAMILSYTFIYAWSEQIIMQQSDIAWVMLVATLLWLTPIRSKARQPIPRAPAADRLATSAAARQPGAARGVAAGTRHARNGYGDAGGRSFPLR